jgi:hypothetical protein
VKPEIVDADSLARRLNATPTCSGVTAEKIVFSPDLASLSRIND